MSMIVKGVNAPKSCGACPCLKTEELDYRGNMVEYFCPFDDSLPSVTNLLEKLPNCPLSDLPEKHGRLIDADSIINDFIPTQKEELEMLAENAAVYNVTKQIAKVFIESVKDCPTVIEAEG